MISCDYCDDPRYDLDGLGYHKLFDDFEGTTQSIPCSYVFSDVLCRFFHDATCIHDSYSIECVAQAASLREFLKLASYSIVETYA
jgi:hypothetical protein